jgi:hypothetical protein
MERLSAEVTNQPPIEEQLELFIDNRLNALERGPITDQEESDLVKLDKLLYEGQPVWDSEHSMHAGLEIVHNIARCLVDETDNQAVNSVSLQTHLQRVDELKPVHFVVLADAAQNSLKKQGIPIETLRGLYGSNITQAIDRVLYVQLTQPEVRSIDQYKLEKIELAAVAARRLVEKAVDDPMLESRTITLGDVAARFHQFSPVKIEHFAWQIGTITKYSPAGMLFRELRSYPSPYPYFYSE